jgi:hypothetical protein
VYCDFVDAMMMMMMIEVQGKITLLVVVGLHKGTQKVAQQVIQQAPCSGLWCIRYDGFLSLWLLMLLVAAVSLCGNSTIFLS